tara:strand:- start:743 stop:1021 length:279 start_codon:yes stop_codon:yes gene_type:complete
MKLSKVLNENYKVYHKSFAVAAQEAMKFAEKKGFEVDLASRDAIEKDAKSRKAGDIRNFKVALTKNYKPTKKFLIFKMSKVGNKVELDARIS